MKLYTVRATRYLVGGEARELYTRLKTQRRGQHCFGKVYFFSTTRKQFGGRIQC